MNQFVARHTGIFARGRKWVRRNPSSALLAASLVALAAAAGWIVWKSEFIRHPLTTGIAVLPFENLSDAERKRGLRRWRAGRHFDQAGEDRRSQSHQPDQRDGISRQTKCAPDRRCASRVSRSGGQRPQEPDTHLHLNAQLIDTRTDTHVWVEQYDRDLNDLFAVQSEIAQKVAEHLHAKLSASEKASIEERPTQDLVAYDFYARAVSMIYNVQVPDESTADTPLNAEKALSEAVDLLNKAVARDPNFFLAYCQLAFAHDLFYARDRSHSRSFGPCTVGH